MFYKVVDKKLVNAGELFTYAPNGQGGYTVTKAEGAQIDHSLKYKVEMVSDFGTGEPVTSKQGSLTVKMGKTKLTLTADGQNLYRRDRHSRGAFSLTAARTSS